MNPPSADVTPDHGPDPAWSSHAGHAGPNGVRLGAGLARSPFRTWHQMAMTTDSREIETVERPSRLFDRDFTHG